MVEGEKGYPGLKAKPHSSAMATTSSLWVRLTKDIEVEILKRLPVRSVAQFRCVCKSWRRLLTDPMFINMHLTHSISSAPTHLFLSRFKNPLTLPLNPNPNPNTQELQLPLMNRQSYMVKGQCHGLICLITSNGTIVLWNPSIQRYMRLPSPSNFHDTEEVIGFGFDSSLNDYKIIRAPSSCCKDKVTDYRPQVEVLTLNSNYWRKLPDHKTPPYFIDCYQQSLTLNSGVYWLSLTDSASHILRFDLSEERFTTVPVPTECSGWNNLSWLGVLQGSLCILNSDDPTSFDILATQDDHNWKKLITVSKILNPRPYLSYLDYAPLCFLESGALLISLRWVGLFVYDPKLERHSMLAELEDLLWLQVTPYTESLVWSHALDRPDAVPTIMQL